METTTTTTSAENKAKVEEQKGAKTPKEMDLYSFLDTHKLTRAERSYYEKHNKSLKGEEKTSAEWSKIIKFIHK